MAANMPDSPVASGQNFLKIIVEPAQTTEIDIVAVHGLNPNNSTHHAENTWTKGSTMWLRDLLPKKLPTARIMVFGYNANVAFESSTAGVLEQAHNLLNWLRLRRRREKAEHRPLIFIAHSLGGIVVKRALVVASQVERYKPIRASTYGMVFFATPHRGGEFVTLGKIAARIVQAVYSSPNNSFLESLEKDSLFANSMIDDFRSFLEDYQVISFFETKPLPKIGIVVDQKSAVLGLSHNRENHIALNHDHNQICKFDRTTDEYELVEENIMEMVENAIERYEKFSRADAGWNVSAKIAVPSPPEESFGQAGFIYPASPELGSSTYGSPRMLMSPELGRSPIYSALTSPDLAVSPNSEEMAGFVAPSRLERASTTLSDSVKSMAISDANSDGRRQSSSTLATEAMSVTSASKAGPKNSSPNWIASIGMNLKDTGGSAFRKAAATGQKDVVKRMLDNGAPIDNSGAGHGFNALAEAALHGHDDIVELLLDAGADPAFNCVSYTPQLGSIQNTPLSLAAGKGQIGAMTVLLNRHQYSVEELDHAFRAAKYKNRSSAMALVKSRGGGLY